MYSIQNKPLYKGHNLRSQNIPTIHFEPPKEQNLWMYVYAENKSAEFMLAPKCPLFSQRFQI